MHKIDPNKTKGSHFWLGLTQYLVFILSLAIIPATVYVAIELFKVPVDKYYSMGGTFLVQCLLMVAAPWIILKMISNALGSKITEVDSASDPQLYARLLKIAEKSDMKIPKVYRIDSVTPNAFALGTLWGTYITCFTTKIEELLDESELEAVMAHEFGHVKNRDIRLLMCITGLNLIFHIAWNTIVGLLIGRGIQSTEQILHRKKGLQAVSIPTQPNLATKVKSAGKFTLAVPSIALGTAYKFLVYFPYVITLLVSGISRSKEYRADLHSAVTLDEIDHLVNALRKLTMYASRIPMLPTSFNHFLAVPARDHWLFSMCFGPSEWFQNLSEEDVDKEPGLIAKIRNLFQSHPTFWHRRTKMESYLA